MNLRTLEISLLFILTIQLFRAERITNLPIIFITGIFLIVFALISSKVIRLWCLILLVVTVYGFLLIQAVNNRIIYGSTSLHDGVIMTEASYKVLVLGKNPYSENLSETLTSDKYMHVSIRPTIHYPYSPLMFLTSMPVFLVTDSLFGVVDMRVTLFVFFLLSAWIGSFIVKEKVLFLILFSLNPLFVPMLLYGANEAILLFFLVLIVYFLTKKRALLASATLGIGIGTKLLFVPVVPLYFIYIFLFFAKDREAFIKNLKIFFLVSLFIYLPFLLWNSGDTTRALLSPWFGAGEELYPIAGFIGIAQVFTSLGLVSQTTSFPFLLLFLPIEVFFIVFSFKLLKKSLNIHTLINLFVFNFILVLAFSRLVQTYYLAFISQILVLSAFVDWKKKKRLF